MYKAREASGAVTEGILGIPNRDELKGVLAHELTHIKNKDMLISSIRPLQVPSWCWLVWRGGRRSSGLEGTTKKAERYSVSFLLPFSRR
ncbi:MAG: M48 family metalloprotease [Syntrophales bacterium]|nr:M48 family metalloprotease [Syntrophales bacterium]